MDQESIATDVVTEKVRQKDPTISDETARKALGALGLTGEKSLRKVGHLSGGEKARVALASFVLIPHNLLLLDEPSNHLDVTTLKVCHIKRNFILLLKNCSLLGIQSMIEFYFSYFFEDFCCLGQLH